MSQGFLAASVLGVQRTRGVRQVSLSTNSKVGSVQSTSFGGTDGSRHLSPIHRHPVELGGGALAESLSGKSAVTPGSCPGDCVASPSECLNPRNTGNPGESESSETKSSRQHRPERRPVPGYLLALSAAVI